MFVGINDIAQNLMDAYYQNEKPDEEFFQFYHFRYLAGNCYGALMQTDWEQGYALARAEGDGFPMAPLPPEWFVPEVYKVTGNKPDFTITLTNRAFVFAKDKSSSGILQLTSNTSKCASFIRINAYERFGLDMLPHTNDTFWYVINNEIKLFSHCGLSTVTVYKIPSIDTEDLKQNTQIPAQFEEKIRMSVMQFMFGAKSGNIVDFTNNYNTNKTVASEIADYLKKQTP